MNYTVAVRTLCEFTAKEGDLDLRFTPSATALEGRVGHATVAARWSAGYQAEFTLAGHHDRLAVRGRADGYDAARQRVEEIKTFRGDIARMPANRRALHWAQVQVYGALLCRQLELPALTLALVYFDVATQAETVLEARHDAAELQAFFEDRCRRFLAWADQELAHRAARDRGLAGLAFPYADFRRGQRPLAEAVYRAATGGRCLLAEAPTGIGKTLGALYPLLKACPGQQLDKVFFLSAKTPGRAVALRALAQIRAAAGAPLPLRVLELVARDKACEHPGKACHGDACPLARGFYDRLPAARAEVVDVDGGSTGAIDRTRLRQVGLAHGICPYYLGQETLRWADVVVGDYNHWFDTTAMLHGMTLAHEWRVGVLVDEAHNLLPRGRAMYSAQLAAPQLAAAALAPPAIAAAIGRLQRCWGDLARRQADAYAAYDELPGPTIAALQALNAALSDELANATVPPAPALLRLFFDALHFARLCDSFGAHSLFDLTLEGASPDLGTLAVRNLVPAPHLAPRFAAARTTTLFSATLAPMQFHADLLGLPADTVRVEVESPFDAGQLQVRIHADVSTRFGERDASLGPIARLIAAQYREAPGNYLAFFSSFDYLQRAAAVFAASHPDIPLWLQARAMDEGARAAFLERFELDGRGVGFAVLGGAFAEGIDLTGRRLIGAFVATLGLPQVNPVNERLKARLDALFGAGRGHDYAYLFPGLQRVVQAAGRVIRTPEDRGCIHLIDARFDRPAVRALLPRWWALPRRAERPGDQFSAAAPFSHTPVVPKTSRVAALPLLHED